MNKTITFILLIVLIAVGGFIIFGKKTEAPTTNAPSTGAENAPVQTTPKTETVVPPVSETIAPQTLTVTYSDAGYSPRTITIKVGDSVSFVNNSTHGMWTASNPHPQHTDFSAFDAKRAYVAGESYSFTFAKAGTFNYHNHVRSFDQGTVVVK